MSRVCNVFRSHTALSMAHTMYDDALSSQMAKFLCVLRVCVLRVCVCLDGQIEWAAICWWRTRLLTETGGGFWLWRRRARLASTTLLFMHVYVCVCVLKTRLKLFALYDTQTRPTPTASSYFTTPFSRSRRGLHSKLLLMVEFYSLSLSLSLGASLNTQRRKKERIRKKWEKSFSSLYDSILLLPLFRLYFFICLRMRYVCTYIYSRSVIMPRDTTRARVLPWFSTIWNYRDGYIYPCYFFFSSSFFFLYFLLFFRFISLPCCVYSSCDLLIQTSSLHFSSFLWGRAIQKVQRRYVGETPNRIYCLHIYTIYINASNRWYLYTDRYKEWKRERESGINLQGRI